MLETYKGDVFCPECGGVLSLDFNRVIVDQIPGKEYIKRTWFLKCSATQNCPLFNVPQKLPKV